jgi:hypothetical protein
MIVYFNLEEISNGYLLTVNQADQLGSEAQKIYCTDEEEVKKCVNGFMDMIKKQKEDF